eukprot:5789670-Heterocapsa_arctica.AAC.1
MSRREAWASAANSTSATRRAGGREVPQSSSILVSGSTRVRRRERDTPRASRGCSRERDAAC